MAMLMQYFFTPNSGWLDTRIAIRMDCTKVPKPIWHSRGCIYLAQGRVDSAKATAQQSRLIAAGEAILAGSMWNSSGGFVAGIFMQRWFYVRL